MIKNKKLGLNIFGDSPARMHDNLYLKAPPEKIKSAYQQGADLLSTYINKNKGASVLEMGCATGDFANYLKGRFEDIDLLGIDYHQKLIIKAKSKYPKIKFKTGSILNVHSAKKNFFDIITVFGVLSMFDDISLPLKNCKEWLKKGGVLLIFNMFNEYPINTWMRYEKVGQKKGKEVGWNIFSQKTVQQKLKALNFKSIQFMEFKVNFERQIHADDPMRSWTVNINEKKMMLNGTWVLHPLKFLYASK